MDSETQERLKKAAGLKRALGNEDSSQGGNYDSDYPTVEIARIWKSIMEYLGDDSNEALTQLDKGDLHNFYQDETKLFAIAMHFSEHPFDDIEMEFQRRGIMRKIKVAETIRDGKTVPEHEEKYPIKFEVIPLRTFAKEWMKRRHPVNRLRVKELIQLVTGSRLGEQFGKTRQEDNQVQTINNNKRL